MASSDTAKAAEASASSDLPESDQLGGKIGSANKPTRAASQIKFGAKPPLAASNSEQAASTLAQDGRSEVPLDDPIPGNGGDAGDIPPELDRRAVRP
jgi:hypothetical protein